MIGKYETKYVNHGLIYTESRFLNRENKNMVLLQYGPDREIVKSPLRTTETINGAKFSGKR